MAAKTELSERIIISKLTRFAMLQDMEQHVKDYLKYKTDAEHVGWVKVDIPRDFRRSGGDCAAWYTAGIMAGGRWPVIAFRKGTNANRVLRLWQPYILVPCYNTEANYQSQYGGVNVGLDTVSLETIDKMEVTTQYIPFEDKPFFEPCPGYRWPKNGDIERNL